MATLTNYSVDTEPYAVSELEDNSFHFLTSFGNEYQINFAKYWQQELIDLYSGFQIPVYEFCFEVLAKNHAGMDKRIAHTIFTVLDKFLMRTSSIVFYVTQRDDGRSKELFKVYQFWYTLYKQTRGNGLRKIDRIVQYGDVVEAYMACMFLGEAVPPNADMPLLIDSILQEIYPNALVAPL